MKLTTKGRYAVTAMLDIVVNGNDNPVKAEVLALRHNMPVAYLEQLTSLLRAKGLLMSVRGPGGGYLLARASEEISVADILEAVDDNMDATRCQGQGNCHHGATCLTHHLWDELSFQIMSFLQTMTLSKLANNPKILALATENQTLTQPLKYKETVSI